MADRRRTRPLAAALVAVAVAILGLTGPLAATASAHAELESSTPADGATLTAPPQDVTLTFGENLLPDTETLSINDENGNVVTTVGVQPKGAEITMPWPANLGPGTYQVAYRVVSADGHPVMGAVTFTVSGGGSAAAAASATSSAASSSATTSTAPASPTPGAATPAPSQSPADATTTGGMTPSVVVVVLSALVVLALIVLVAVRMVRRPK